MTTNDQPGTQGAGEPRRGTVAVIDAAARERITAFCKERMGAEYNLDGWARLVADEARRVLRAGGSKMPKLREPLSDRNLKRIARAALLLAQLSEAGELKREEGSDDA